LISLSTLRSESRLSPRKTRFRLLARLYRTGLATRKVLVKGFTSRSSSPELLGAMSVHFSLDALCALQQRAAGISSHREKEHGAGQSANRLKPH